MSPSQKHRLGSHTDTAKHGPIRTLNPKENPKENPELQSLQQAAKVGRSMVGCRIKMNDVELAKDFCHDVDTV